jgi:CBS-domain-containing membrane protein
MQLSTANPVYLPVRERCTLGADGNTQVSRTVPCAKIQVTKSLRECTECRLCDGIAYQAQSDRMVVICRSPLEDEASASHNLPAVVADLMSGMTQCISQDAGLDLLCKMLLHSDSLTLPVVDDNGHVKGSVGPSEIVTCMRQLLGQTSLAAGGQLNRTVRDVMTASTFALSEHATIAQAAALMALDGISQLPIVNERNVLVGVATTSDITRWVARHAGYIL